MNTIDAMAIEAEQLDDADNAIAMEDLLDF